MNTATDTTRLVDDLAGHLTDSALEMVKAAGVPAISIDLELATWHTLKKVIQSEVRRQPRFRLYPPGFADAVLAKVLHKATLLVAQEFTASASDVEALQRIRSISRTPRATATERDLFFQIVRQPRIKALSRVTRRTDSYPRLQAAAVGG